jgi:uncharacterized protein YprB with RNaseH-like and TPR domain
MSPSESDAASGATLPPDGDSPATVLTIPGEVVRTHDVEDVIADALDAIDPDLVVATPPDAAHVALPPVTDFATVPVVDPSRSASYHFCPDAGVVFAAVPSPDNLPPTPADIPADEEGHQSRDAIEHGYVITSQLELTIDPHHRETRLEGIDDYLTALPDAWHDGTLITHLATTLRAEYQTVHQTDDTIYPVYGAGPPTNSIGAGVDETKRPMIELSVYSNGAVNATKHDASNFGLRGLESIGPAKAEKLRDHGFTSRDAIAETTPNALTSISGFGKKTASTVHSSATAIAKGEIVPQDGGTLPSGDPIFIDIETNGLNGDIAWLVGVLDGDSHDGRYLSFRQQTHDEPAEHLNAFMSWLTGPAEDRPVVAWNGYGFDFPIIKQQLETHVPKWTDIWDARYQFDPFYYATDQEYATLPARSNRLEPVATALGWEPTTTGLDGAAAAAEYNAWRQTADRPDGYQPDWHRLEAYCEDDVRALATIYEALEDASRHAPGAGNDNSQTDTTQGSLSDFS